MRLALLCLVFSTTAAAQPPSKMLERGIKLYDHGDYFSASIELAKVFDMQVDTPANLQRAEFFMAKTIYHMGFPAASLSWFDKIQQHGAQHAYFAPSAKWIVAIIRTAPSPTTRYKLGAYDTKLLDDPMMASIRDELAYNLGRELATRDQPRETAIAILETVRGAELRGKAQIEIARLKFRGKDIDGGIRHALASGLTDEAARLIASWTHTLDAFDRARGPLAELAKRSAYARYQHSRSMIDGKAELPGIEKVNSEAFDAIMLAAACSAQWPDDLKPLARQKLVDARAGVDELVAMEDNADLFALVEKARKTDPVIARMVADPIMQERYGWIAELRHELDLVTRSDKAWQTTQIAAEILQELTVIESIEHANAGTQIRERLKLFDGELKQLARVLDGASPGFAFSAGPEAKLGEGLVVTNELCGAPMSTMIAAKAQMRSSPRASGCVGCSGGYDGGIGCVWLCTFWLVRRRSSRAATSPT